MKTASVRELRNDYSKLLRWIEAGEEIAISRRGEIIARLIPERRPSPGKVNWPASAALRRDRTGERRLRAEETALVLRESQGHL